MLNVKNSSRCFDKCVFGADLWSKKEMKREKYLYVDINKDGAWKNETWKK